MATRTAPHLAALTNCSDVSLIVRDEKNGAAPDASDAAPSTPGELGERAPRIYTDKSCKELLADENRADDCRPIRCKHIDVTSRGSRSVFIGSCEFFSSNR